MSAWLVWIVIYQVRYRLRMRHIGSAHSAAAQTGYDSWGVLGDSLTVSIPEG